MKEHSYFCITHQAVDVFFLQKKNNNKFRRKAILVEGQIEGCKNNTFSERIFTSCDALDLKFASTFFVDDKLAFQIDTS